MPRVKKEFAMKRFYIGNLYYNTTEAELRNLFKAHGAVEKVTIVNDQYTGRHRGFGFVEMTNASEADRAVAALNGTDLGGRTLTIKEANPKPERPRGGGHRFGGGGGQGRDDYRGHPRQPREPR
jgi:RNA recognition motif-containing protein